MSHLTSTLLLASLVSASVAFLGHRTARERVYLAAYMFLSCVVATVAGGWVMYLIHG